MRKERIVIGSRELVLERPVDPESLIDEARFADDEFLPYWAELWPSGLALARHVATLDLTRKRVLELGCGLALPSFAAAAAGAHVLATDWAPECIELVELNAAANGLDIDASVLDWETPTNLDAERYDLVIAADVLYEARNAQPLLVLLDTALSTHGAALIADPGRRHAPAFFERAQAEGWSLERTSIAALPAGGIFRLERRARETGGSLPPLQDS
jgi:predicted nicotinamide N-methyase